MIEFLSNPYVIILIVVSVIVSNLMLLKYTAKTGMKHINKKINDLNDQEQKLDKKDPPKNDQI